MSLSKGSLGVVVIATCFADFLRVSSSQKKERKKERKIVCRHKLQRRSEEQFAKKTNRIFFESFLLSATTTTETEKRFGDFAGNCGRDEVRWVSALSRKEDDGGRRKISVASFPFGSSSSSSREDRDRLKRFHRGFESSYVLDILASNYLSFNYHNIDEAGSPGLVVVSLNPSALTLERLFFTFTRRKYVYDV